MKYVLLAFLFSVTANAGKLQNADFATSAQITGAGGTVAQLLNTSKIYDNVNAQVLNTTIASKQPNLSTSAAVANQFLTAFTAPNTFSRAQPAFSDLSGSISTSQIPNTAVTAGSYTNTNLTVDAQGRITAAANGSAGGVTSVSGTAPIVSSGGATPAISCIVATGSVAGCLASADFNTFNGKQDTISTSSAVANQFVTGFTAPNTFTRAQPAFSDLSGSVAASQMPALTGDVTTTAGTVATTIANLAVTNAKIANSTIDLTTKVTGILPVSNGGTGAASLTANNVVLGNGTSAVQLVAPGTSGNVLTSNGTTWASTAPSGGGGGEFVGAVTWVAAASCSWQRNNTAFGSYSADADCTTPTGGSIIGNGVSAPGTKIPAITITNTSTSYIYRFEATGRFKEASSADVCSWRFSDGTTDSRTTGAAGVGISVPVILGAINFPTTGSKTVEIQARNTSGLGNCTIDSDNSGYELTIYVYRFPLQP